MTSLKNIENCVVAGLEDRLNQVFDKPVTVVMANQTGHIPDYPYVSYTVTTPIDANAKKWCRAADGTLFRQLSQVWSFTVQSDSIDDADTVMQHCFEWFDILSNAYLSENNISVERIMNVGNRDNMITIEYEYRRGFDVRITFMYVIDAQQAEDGTDSIKEVEFTSNFKEEY